MKRIIFKRLWLENFCNHIGKMSLDFNSGKVALITGPNGSGKTSMLQALPYALYGVCDKGRGEDVLNNKVQKDCCAGVQFEINGDDYIVERYIKYSRKGTTVILKKNGEPIAKGHKEVVPYIDKILIPRESFSNTLMFSQGVKTFFTDLNDSDQKSIFRKVLNLVRYIGYLKEVVKRKKKIEQELIILNNNLEINKSLQDESNKVIYKLELDKREFEKNKKETLKNFGEIINQLLERINSHKEKIKNCSFDSDGNVIDYEELLKVIYGKIGNYETTINDSESKLKIIIENIESKKEQKESEFKHQIEKHKSELATEFNNSSKELSILKGVEEEKVRNMIDEISKKLVPLEKDISSKTADLKYKINEKTELESNMITSNICPTCKQSVSEEIIITFKNKILEIDNEISCLTVQIENNKNIINSISTEINNLKKDSTIVDTYNEKIKELKINYNEKCTILESNLKSALSKLDEIIKKQISKERESDSENIISLTRQLNGLKKQKQTYEEIKEYKKRLNKELEEMNERMSKLKASFEVEKEKVFDEVQLISLNEKYKLLIDEVRQLTNLKVSYIKKKEILDLWDEGFSNRGIQSMLIDQSIPYMNETIHKYMQLISNGRYKVSFDTIREKDSELKDKFTVSIFDTETHSDSRVKFSPGQKRVVDIGTILTLHDLQSNVQDIEFNILIFDEIFDSLDDTNTEYVAQLIRGIKNKWIGIISHTKIDQIESDELYTFN